MFFSCFNQANTKINAPQANIPNTENFAKVLLNIPIRTLIVGGNPLIHKGFLSTINVKILHLKQEFEFWKKIKKKFI
jgi:hypothetical protein